MPSWSAGYGGSIGGQFRLVVEGDLVAQEEDNNRSLVRYRAYMTRVSGGSRAWNLYGTPGNTNFNGDNPGRNINYDFNIGIGARFYLVNNWDKWIGHDGAGNATIYLGANHNASNSPYITTAATGGNWGLPGLYQGIGISGVSFNTITDVSFKVRVTTNRTANRLELSINGGAWTTYYNGNFSDVTVQVGSPTSQLNMNTSYSVRARVRRASNGNLGESGTTSVVTAVGGFFDIGDF